MTAEALSQPFRLTGQRLDAQTHSEVVLADLLLSPRGMQLQMISTPQKSVQFVGADATVAATWLTARKAGVEVVMIREGAEGSLRMLRRAELEHYSRHSPRARLSELPLHDVGVASSLATVRELQTQLEQSGVEAVVMMRSNQVLALLAKPTPAPESCKLPRVAHASKYRAAA